MANSEYDHKASLSYSLQCFQLPVQKAFLLRNKKIPLTQVNITRLKEHIHKFLKSTVVPPTSITSFSIGAGTSNGLFPITESIVTFIIIGSSIAINVAAAIESIAVNI